MLTWYNVVYGALPCGLFSGNMGDVIQPIAMKRLLASVAPNQCFWFAHPWNEDSVRGFRIGEFFGEDTSRLIHLTSDHAQQVRVRVGVF